MSRTIRRKNWDYSKERWITHDYIQQKPCGNKGYWAWIIKPEKELKRALARQHSDAGYSTYSSSGYGPNKDFRKMEQRKYRAQCCQEINKFFKNLEYEVLILDNPKLDYWD